MKGRIFTKKYRLFLPLLLFLIPLTAFGQESGLQDSTSDTTLGRATEVHIGNGGITIIRGKGGEISNRVYIDQKKLSKLGSLPLSESESGDIVRFGEDIILEEGEVVNGDVVAIGGDIQIAGKVTGDVAAVGGDVVAKSTAIIRGDAVSVGGKVRKEPGAQIRGSRIATPFFPFPPKSFLRWGTMGWKGPRFYPYPRLFAGARFTIVLFFVFLFLTILITLFLPNHIKRINASIEEGFLKAGLVGFLADILILPIFVMLCITVIGIPVALLVEPIVLFVALILGFAGISFFLGEKINQTTNLTLSSPLAKVLVGGIIIELLPILAILLGIRGGVFSPVAWVLSIVGWLTLYIGWTVGFGAVFLTRFGTRPLSLKKVNVQEEETTNPQGELKETPAD